MSVIIRQTASVCPVCLKPLPATLERVQEKEGVFLHRTCPLHGDFFDLVWRDRFPLEDWISREEPLSAQDQRDCSGDCRHCGAHPQGTCCVLLEVTGACNLSCPFCFARGGETMKTPSLSELKESIDQIASLVPGALLQLSGGEPTLREDLPELVAYAKKAGCSYVQLNTNGLRLSKDEDYVRRLSESGLDIVFLQFDGTEDSIYEKLRGGPLLEAKLTAIRSCDRHRIGVTLVPTIVRGINDQALGDLVRLALKLFPAVRSVHFQPVTYLGRVPKNGPLPERLPLDELMAELCRQSGLPSEALLPSRCDHALCEFHATFLVDKDRRLIPMTDRRQDQRKCHSTVQRNRDYVANHWRRKEEPRQPLPEGVPSGSLLASSREEMDFDTFVSRMRNESFTLSAMAFQDAGALNLERLRRCSLHVFEAGRLLPFCGKYLTPLAERKQP